LQPVFVDEDRVAEMQQTGFTRNFRDADGSWVINSAQSSTVSHTENSCT
jgi:hypothetical protein